MNRVKLEVLTNGDIYRELDVDINTSFEFNLRFGDLTNPTTTKVPFSTQINIPMTSNNNDIFNHIWRIDHNVHSFNPLKRVPFRLFINNNLYEIGYVKLETVDRTYNIRLFGGLGDYFYTMSNIKIKDLDWEELSHYINKDQLHSSLQANSLVNINKDIISDKFKYALTYQGKYDDFDNKSIATLDKDGRKVIQEVKWSYKDKTFQSVDLKEHHRAGTAHYDYGDWEYAGEYRSYYQRPALKLSYMFEKILNRMTEEGWKTNLDSSFFNRSNPYWEDVWVIKKQYKVDGSGGIGSNVEVPKMDDNMNIEGIGYNYSGKFLKGSKGGFVLRGKPKLSSVMPDDNVTISIPITISSDGWNIDNPIDISAEIPFRILVTMPTNNPKPKDKPMRKVGGDYDMRVKCYIKHTNTVTNMTQRINLYDNDSETKEEVITLNDLKHNNNRLDLITPQYNRYTDDNTQHYISTERGTQEFSFRGSGKITPSTLDNKAENNKFELVFYVDGTTWWRRNDHNWYTEFGARIDLLAGTEINIVKTSKNQEARSSRLIKASNIFQDDKNCFEFITSYCKMFGLMFEKNPVKKEINILTRPTYFQGLNIVDWSNKMDRKEPYEITPVPFEYRYGVFKYNNKKTKFEEDYSNKFDKDYGSLVFDNGLEFTGEQKDYIDKIIFDNGIYVKERSQYYLGRDSDLLSDNKSLLHFENKSGAKVDTDYVLAFYGGKKNVSQALLLTDDTDDMLIDGYCWTDRQDSSILTYKYNDFKRELGKNDRVYSLKFGRPQLAYHPDDLVASHSSPYIGSETIYRRFWSDFINGRFDKNNKLLKAKFDINNIDLIDIFRKFVKIDDTLWVVEKINDFNPTNNELTDVVLIKVKDINNFVSQDLDLPDLKIYDGNDTLLFDFKAGIGNMPLWVKESKTTPYTAIKIVSDTNWYINPITLSADKLEGKAGATTIKVKNPEFIWASGSLYFNNSINSLGLYVFKESILTEGTSRDTASLNRSWITEDNMIK